MSASLRHEIDELKKRRKKAQNEGDLVEEGKICNQLGDLSSQCGDNRLALHYHQCELSLSEAVGDRLGAAVAHRRVGECECELGNYGAALGHQQEHLRIAEELGDQAEVQRALTTLGRTYLHQADREHGEETDQLLLKAGTAFLKSLDVCDKLAGGIPEREVLSMRSRSYLNLGLVYEIRGDYKSAQEFMQKALGIVKELGDPETVFKCHLDLGSLHLKVYHPSEAIVCFKEALSILKKKANVQQMADTLREMAKAHLLLSDFEAAKDCLKKVRRLQGESETVDYSLRAVRKVLKYRDEVELLGMNRVDERLQLLEKLGDLCCNLGAYPSAILYYEQQLSLAEAHGLEPEALSKVYYSLASTHTDYRQFSEAMVYYEKELKLWESRPSELCSTWSNIARLHEAGGQDKSLVQEAYHKAIDCAKEANSPKDLIAIYRSLLNYCQWSPGLKAERRVCEQELAALIRLHPHADVPAEDTDTPSLSGDSPTTNSSGSETDEGKDTGTASFPIEAPSRTQHSRKKSRVFKRNEKGETLLHIASVEANVGLVERLIKEGADISAQDHCGWTPLHEASNRGHTDVVRMILDHGANVNDKGGPHCNGTTPLMDAALNGHTDVVQLLLDHGANPLQRNNQGLTVVEMLESSLSSVEAESGQAYELADDHRSILACLRNHLMASGHSSSSPLTPIRASTSQSVCGVVGTQPRCKASHGARQDATSASLGNRASGGGGGGVRYNPLGQVELPALLPEDGGGEEAVTPGGGDDWLVDDMGPPTGKRRRSTPHAAVTRGTERREKGHVWRERGSGWHRPRTLARSGSTVEGVGSPSPSPLRTSSSPAPPWTTPTKNTPPKHTPPKNLPIVDTETRTKNTPPGATPPTLTTPTESVLRLRVLIEDRTYLVPCPRKVDGLDTTVGWLSLQAAERYCVHQGVRPVLTLTTIDGAHLCPTDAIADVLQNNEEVRGVVEQKELPPLSERYQNACRHAGVVCHPRPLQLFLLSNHISVLDLSNVGLRALHAPPLFHALRGLGTLTSLNLSGNPLGDASLIHLTSCLHHLPSLTHLDLTCTRVTGQGLVASVVPTAPAESAWQHLLRLALAYNGLGGGGARGVAAVLRHCRSLQGLVLEGCGLTERDCDCHELPDALKALRDLSELNISRNLLEGAGVNVLMASLRDVRGMRILDVSATCKESSICGSLCGGPSLALLQRLDLSHGCIGDDGVQDMVRLLDTCAHLQDLGLAGNDLAQLSVGPLCGYLMSTSCVKTLDLSANCRLCNAACLQLLDAVLSSSVVHLNLSFCGMVSPLPLTAMERPKQPLGMERLDLSGNMLNASDCSFMCEWLGGFSLVRHNAMILAVK